MPTSRIWWRPFFFLSMTKYCVTVLGITQRFVAFLSNFSFPQFILTSWTYFPRGISSEFAGHCRDRSTFRRKFSDSFGSKKCCSNLLANSVLQKQCTFLSQCRKLWFLAGRTSIREAFPNRQKTHEKLGKGSKRPNISFGKRTPTRLSELAFFSLMRDKCFEKLAAATRFSELSLSISPKTHASGKGPQVVVSLAPYRPSKKSEQWVMSRSRELLRNSSRIF